MTRSTEAILGARCGTTPYGASLRRFILYVVTQSFFSQSCQNKSVQTRFCVMIFFFLLCCAVAELIVRATTDIIRTLLPKVNECRSDIN